MTLSCGHEYENGSGRRERCPACARAQHLKQMNEYNKARHKRTYEPKRRPK